MRRFRFQLDPLLRLRQVREEEAEIALARAHERLREAIERERAIEADLHQRRRLRAAVSTGALDMVQLQAAVTDEESLESALGQSEERKAEAETEIGAALNCLTECRRSREALDQLRERRLSEHRHGLQAEEQQAMDESAIVRFRRS